MTSEKDINQQVEVMPSRTHRGGAPTLASELARCFTELVASTPNQRNWRGILIALLVIGCVCGLIIFSVVLLTPPDAGPRFTGNRFALADIISGAFKPPGFNGKWISGTEIVFGDDSGGVSLLHVPTLIVTPLVSNFTFRRLNVEEFDVSPDKRYILLKHDVLQDYDYISCPDEFPTRHFRHLAKYTVLQMDSEHVVSVTPFPSKEGHPELQHVVWVPGAAASLVMVHENDIYVKESPTSPVVSRLTTTGERHKVFNGVTDYLYREYVLHSVSAVWASEEGNRLCYASFNDSGVREAKIPVYTDKYATINQVRYPKVDTNNPVATLWVVELGQSPPAPRDLKPPTRVRDQSVGVWDYYFTGVSWVDADTVAVVWRNRAQNVSVVTACTEPMWFCEELYVEESGPRRWATVEKVPLFAMNGTAFVSVAPLVDSTSGTYPHIHQGSTGTVHTIPVTFGTYTVFSVVGWDTENHHVYYVANTETEVAERHLWRVTDVTSPTPRQQECLTCHLNYTTPPCRHFTPYMGPDNFYEVVLQCEGPGVPHTMLYSIVDEEVLLYIHNNTHLQRLSLEMAWPQRKDYRVKLDGGFVAQVRLSIPPEFTEEEAFIYPVMVQVGGVPGEQRVNHKWHVDWTTYLASNKSWVAMEVDVRGASSQDLGLMYKPAWRLGEVEVTDHVAVVKSLLEKLEFLDGSRVAAFGWGHSGYNTARLLAQDTDKVFACAAVVNPITDWSLYSSYYTEKYMGTAQVVPGGNYRGYEESSLLLRASSFKNRTLLLVHGSADTDVHYDHTLKFSRALTKKGIIFRQQTYTDEGHDLERVQTHLYKTLESYLEGCFPAYNEEELSLLFGQDALP
ncbi:inactive dipeptidyl peptidase 10-like [Homarus americanus]|uniref:inactive dipeptidyl peptidase 10-like n=1 Tax=Homarus americanus TaxID=6706 RepID=UPI001C48A3F1|nr:inactive dipeptidyl peptidase 10-like [Homarus americanus]